MPVVLLLPLVAILGSFICFTLSQMIVRGQFSDAASGIPVIGHYIARGIAWMEAGLIRLANQYIVGNVKVLVHWFVGLAQNLAGFLRQVGATIGDLPDTFDHLLNVAVHDVVKAFVNPVRDRANAAYNAATGAAGDVSDLAGSIAGRITSRLDAFRREITGTIEGDVADALSEAERWGTREANRAGAAAERVANGIGADVRGLENALGDLLDPRTLAEVLAGVGGLAALVALVETQVMPLVRDLTECSPKLRATCQVGSAEWLGLLEGLVLAGSIPSLIELARMAQGFVSEFAGDAADMVGISEAGALVPAHPRGW